MSGRNEPSTPPSEDLEVESEAQIRRQAEQQRNRAGAGILASLGEVILIVGAAFILALFVQQFVIKPFSIPSASMVPTLQEGDRVLVNRFLFYFQEPEKGDVVVFHPPIDPETDYIKRVVGVEGDVVAVVDGRLVVNGEVQEEPYLNGPIMNSDFEAFTVGPDQIFVMGDNRNSSGDSRVFGPVDVDQVLGEAFLVYWPLGRIDTL
ncbi:MAG TPA: signal peptidase I [Thermoleophilia bacterium]|nr:signal peptidase I [Thermoleophilia bacterium]